MMGDRLLALLVGNEADGYGEDKLFLLRAMGLRGLCRAQGMGGGGSGRRSRMLRLPGRTLRGLHG